MLRIDQTTTDTLQGDEGTFLAQKAGQNFVCIAVSGHSIASLRAVAPTVQVTQPTTGNDPWFVTKISESTEIRASAN